MPHGLYIFPDIDSSGFPISIFLLSNYLNFHSEFFLTLVFVFCEGSNSEVGEGEFENRLKSN